LEEESVENLEQVSKHYVEKLHRVSKQPPEQRQIERKKVNYRLAGKTASISYFSKDLAHKYSEPGFIRFNKNAYADFEPYAKEKITSIKLTGDNGKDIKIAGDIMKRRYPDWKKPLGYTWHHHQDRKTMLLVPTDLHDAVRHSGGASLLRETRE